jgi:cold shock CspA family protein
MATKVKGTIVAFNVQRGWGFIEGADGETYFYHVTNSPLYKPVLGQAVLFKIASPFKMGQREQAINIAVDPDGVSFGVSNALAGGVQ